jgi:hypothetical protein
MARKPKLQAEIVPNQHCRLYHTNFKISENSIHKTLPGDFFKYDEDSLKNASEATKKLVIGINSIEGVDTFSVSQFQVQIVKVPLIEWDEIEPQVVGLIRLLGQELVGEEVEHIEKPIWEFQKWGLNADGTKRREAEFEELLDGLD